MIYLKKNNFFKIIKGIFKEIQIIFLYFFTVFILSLIFYKGLESNYNFCNLLINLILLTIFIFIFRTNIIPSWNDFKKNGFKYIKNSFIYYLIGLLIMLISSNIISSFYKLPINETLNRNDLLAYPIFSLIEMVICAPIIEELMTRVILKDNFNNKYIYAFLSGIIFGILHIIVSLVSGNYFDCFYIISYGALGISFALIYEKCDNIWASITYHAFHNLLCIILIIGGLS